MGMFDTISLKCNKCKNETLSQTKILGDNNLDTFEIGDNITNKEFNNCKFQLKNKCHICHNQLIIKIKQGKIVKTCNEEPNVVEKDWGEYEWIK